MLGKSLGIDIIEDTITAVLVKSGLQGRQILACETSVISEEEDFSKALEALLDKIDPTGAVCISAIPSENVSYRNLDFPFKDVRKIRQAVPFELESLLPFSVEELLVDFTITSELPDRTEILAAAVKRSYLDEHLTKLSSQGIDPEILDIRNVPTVMMLLKQDNVPDNGLFIDIGKNRATIILFLSKRIVLIRKLSFPGGEADRDLENSLNFFSKAVHNSLVAFVDQTDERRGPAKVFVTGSATQLPDTLEMLERFLELPVQGVNLCEHHDIQMDENITSIWKPALMDNALAMALRDSKKDIGFNFRREEFEPKKQLLQFRKDIRYGAIIMAVILAFLAIDFGVDYYFLKKRYTLLDKQIRGIFSQTFPEVQRIVDPIHQMRVKVNELKKTAGAFSESAENRKVLDLLEDISRRVDKSLDVKATRVVIDTDGIQIKGSTDTFNTVDNIKQGLDDSTIFKTVTITSANLDRTGSRVQFEIRSQLQE